MAIRYLSGINVDSNTLFVDDANNRVGIGTGAPTAKLQLYGSGLVEAKVTSTNDQALLYLQGTFGQVANNAGDFYITNSAPSSSLILRTADTERMRITSGGNVGIGTTSPGGRLHIATPDPATNFVAIDFRNPTYGIYGKSNSISGRGNTLEFTATDYNTNGSVVTREVLTLRPEGNVGIGTTAPVDQLAIGASSSVAGFSVGSGLTQVFLRYNNYFNVSNQVSDATKGTATIGIGRSSDGVITFWTAAAGAGAPVERMRINNTGNVGIGTTNPGYKLDVVASSNSTYPLIVRNAGNAEIGGIYSTSGGAGQIYLFNASSVATAKISTIDASYFNGGNLLVGTTTDAGQTFQVVGSSSLRRASGTTQTNIVEFKNTTNDAYLTVTGIGTTSDVATWTNGSMVVEAVPFSTGSMILSAYTGSLIIQTGRTNRLEIGSSGTVRLNNYGSGSKTGTVAYNLAVDSSGNIIETAGGVVDGSGTANYVSKWSDANTLTDSQLFDNGTSVGIGTASPSASYRLTISGSTYQVGTDSKIYVDNGGVGGASAILGVIGTSYGYLNTDGPYPFVFQTNNAERMRITSDGNVGIGTTGPQSKLQVARAGNANGGTILMGVGGSGTDKWSFLAGTHYNQATGSGNGSGSAGVALIGANTTETSNAVYIGGGPYEINPATVIVFNTYTATTHNLGGLERMRITSDGNLSIGTTANPGSRTNIYISESGATPNAILRLQNSGSQYLAKMILTDGNTNDAVIGYQGGVTGATQYLGFGLGTAITQMVLNGAGNVGIGTTVPGYKLDVSGDINFSNTLKFGGVNVIHNGSTDVYGNIRVLYSASTLADGMYINYNSAGGGGAHLRFFANSTTERMRIDASSGYVGINTTNPQALLHVQGSNLMTTFRNSDTGVDQYSQIEFVAGSRTAYIWLGNQNTTSWAGAGGLNIYTANGNMDLWTGNTQQVRITNGGNFLIGTTTDGGYKLRVNGAGRYDDYLQLWSGTAGASPRLIFGGETSSTDKSIFLESYYMVFQGHNNEGFKFQTTSSAGAVTNRMSILGTGTVVLSNYGSGSKTGTVAYNLAVDASGNVIETAGGVVDGSGTANYVTKWQDANTVTDSQIVDNGTNVGINNASPKTKLDVNGTIGFGSKTLNISDTFVTVLTVNMSNHTGCYVKITAFGDWSAHSAVAYLGEFFLQNGASAYNEPGVIIRQVDNTNTDDIVAQIVDPAGTGTRDFEIQLKTTSASGVPFSAAIQYEVRGQYNSVS